MHRVMVSMFTIAMVMAVACKRSPPEAQETTPKPAACVAIPSTSLCWELPSRWQVEPATPAGPAEPPSAEGASGATGEDEVAELLAGAELVASGRRVDPDRKTTLDPRVEVYRDKDLPAGTSVTDYLVANRSAQKRSLGVVAVRHLEVEPVRREGRRGFHLRDAFDVPLPKGGKAPVSQQALLLLDGDDGYVIVVTSLEDDRAALAEEIRSWLASVSFR